MIVRSGMGFTKPISLIGARRARHLLYAVVAKNIINSVQQQKFLQRVGPGVLV
jgi:hypothetical protein